MFLVNRLLGISNPQSPAKELTTLDGGRLFLVRPDSVKSGRECIFIDASLSIRRTTHAHMYQLVVTRAFQEGEEGLLEEDAENLDERSFLLDASLFLSLGPSLDPSITSPLPLSYTWLDPDGDGPDDEFEFVLPSEGAVAEQQAREFERLCWRCMWERKENRDWPEDESEAERVEQGLEEEFKVERSPQPAAATSSLYPSLSSSSATASPSLASRPPTKSPLFRASSPSSSDEEDDLPPRASSAPDSDSEGEDSFAEATRGYISAPGEDEDEEDELAAQLMQKATITPSSPAKSATQGKGKGKASAAAAAAVDDIAEPVPLPPKPCVPAATSSPDVPVLSITASLHLYDRATGLFMQQDASVRAGLYKLPPSPEEGREAGGYWLVVESLSSGREGEVWVSQGVSGETTVNFAEKERAMVFNYSVPAEEEQGQGEGGGQTFTWLLRLSSEEEFGRLQAEVSEALFEDKWGKGSWRKLKEEERIYARKAWLEEDEEMWVEEVARGEERDEEEEGSAEEEEEESEEEEVREEDSDSEVDSDDNERPVSSSRAAFSKKKQPLKIGEKKRSKNSALAVGYKDDLSFVVQGDMIGVFKQQREGGKKLKFVTSIVNLATPKGKGFTPGKVMLHNQDTSMILQNPLAPGSLYRLDLETGKIVDELSISPDFAVSNFLPSTKFAQMTQDQTFIGHSHNGVFRVDPRLNGSKLVESEFKQYATKADFSAAATTENGRLAVASVKGDIRLYDKLGKNAKTALPALGDPILGIDVSADGRWVLATCKTYLLLIDTKIPESSASKFAGQSGFDRSFPAAEKPTPRRLTLRPEHEAHMREVVGGGGVNFTPAKFNAALDGTAERTIVTSTGPFIVAWNFRQVKAGNVANYTLRRFGEDVVADNFKFGGDREIIVTLPENVFVEEKKKLKAPTRDSIANVVRTWDGL
ncbi:hypothetical protein JCM11641_001283 [Rhodosporidiobolus odoratus]